MKGLEQMKHSELEEELENIGLSFEIKDNIGRRWNISPVLLVKGSSVLPYRPYGDIDGLHFQIECIEGTARQLGLSYDIYTLPIIKTNKSFVFTDEIGDKTLLEEEVGKIFVKTIEKKLTKSAVRLLFLYPEIEEWIKKSHHL